MRPRRQPRQVPAGAHFTDVMGRRWTVSCGPAQAAAVQQAVGIYLPELAADLSRLARLIGDPRSLSAVLWVLCCRQAGKAGVAQDEFRQAVIAEADEAAQAFCQALLDACGSPMTPVRLPVSRGFLRLLDRATRTSINTMPRKEQP